MDSAGIYVHIPFCHAKCGYCDFFSTPRTARAQAVVQQIVNEYHARRHELADARIRTIYFGGGTPSSLPPEMLATILQTLPTAQAEEITIEVNPEDVTPEAAASWRKMGFNRASMGIQSFDDEQLRTAGRRHSAADAVSAYHTLREAGFANIGCDLIFGLPGQTPDSWKTSLTRLLNLRPEHISAYCLSYEPGTRFHAMLQAGRVAEAEPEVLAEMYSELHRLTTDAGYHHYEISSFCRPEYASKHNSSYWQSTPYLGLGPAAHSYDGAYIRRANPADLKAYLSECPSYTEEILSETDRANDVIITRLRTSRGLDPTDLPSHLRTSFIHTAQTLIQSQALEQSQTRYRIPYDHWFISDSILRDLLF